MPVIIAAIVVSFFAGLVTRPAAAYAVAGVLAFLVNVVFVWAIADGKGNDPAWILALSIAGGLVALGAARVAAGLRHRLTSRTVPGHS